MRRQSPELLVHPHQDPPILGTNDLGAVGFPNADEQERGFRFLDSHRRAGLRGFVQQFEKRIAKREVRVIDRSSPTSLLP